MDEENKKGLCNWTNGLWKCVPNVIIIVIIVIDFNHSRAVSIICRACLDIKVIDKWDSGTGRPLIVNFELEGFILTCVNVYAPNEISRRKTFFAFSKSMIQQKCNNLKGLIIAGDMNCCLTPLDKSTQINDSSVDSMKCLVRELGVADIWRTLNPTNRMYSHHNYASGTSSRLDCIFISNILCSVVTKTISVNIAQNSDQKQFFVKKIPTETRKWILDAKCIFNFICLFAKRNYRVLIRVCLCVCVCVCVRVCVCVCVFPYFSMLTQKSNRSRNMKLEYIMDAYAEAYC